MQTKSLSKMEIYLVGGAVRDKLLGLPVTERDWVVVGATVEEMLACGFRQVGKEFPVFLHPETGEEYALARRERKVKPGYKGFEFESTPSVSLKDDLVRRDLSINAMAESKNGELIDYYHGAADLKAKILRHVSPAFAEDPVRILRVGRFLARYYHLGFKVAPQTIALMQQMVAKGEVNALVAERVWKELERALLEKNPEQFFLNLASCGALEVLFPHLLHDRAGLKALISAAQLNTSAPVRFAALLHALPEDEDDQYHTRELINQLCHRYRAPNTFRELAILTALHHQVVFKAPTLSTDQLLRLFSTFDIYRRFARFQAFLLACDAIARSKHIHFAREWVEEAAQIAKADDIKKLVTAGLTGQHFALALQNERRDRLSAWLQQNGLL